LHGAFGVSKNSAVNMRTISQDCTKLPHSFALNNHPIQW